MAMKWEYFWFQSLLDSGSTLCHVYFALFQDFADICESLNWWYMIIISYIDTMIGIGGINDTEGTNHSSCRLHWCDVLLHFKGGARQGTT